MDKSFKEKKERFLKRIKNEEQKLVIAKYIDKFEKAEKANKITYTSFLNLSESKYLKEALNYLDINYYVFDLDETLTRKIIFYFPSYISKNIDKQREIKNAISVLKISATKNSFKLSHKDYMGAILSLGIKPEKLGDITVKEGFAYVFVTTHMAEFIELNLLSVAKADVKSTYVDFFNIDKDEFLPTLKKISIIVSSLRVDVILATLYNLSRSDIKSRIENGDMLLNDVIHFWLGENINEGDILSLRHFGKFRVGKVLNRTRSNRINLEIYKYV